MVDEPRWITPAVVIDIAETVLEDTGEPFLVRDAGLLESSLMVPRNRWYYEKERDFLVLGLSLALAIARNHPFEQGNKRAAWFAMLNFFGLNDLALLNEDDPAFADLFIDVITGAQPPDELLRRMRLFQPD